MHTDLKLALTHLAKGELLPLRDGHGKGVAVFHGNVWVTQESDPQDHVLGTGKSFAIDRPGLAIAQALSDARVLVFDVDTRPAPAVPAVAPAELEAPRVHLAPRSSIEWHFEARRQRAQAIGDAIASALLALGRLWARLRSRVKTAVTSGVTPASHGQ